MEITPETIRYIAHLARLNIKDQEVVVLAGECTRIINFVARLHELETAGINPMHGGSVHSNALRKDVPATKKNHAEAQKLREMLPAQKNGFATVPEIFAEHFSQDP
ncbi:MAG: aspartyl-tRNA(Asn)/glutamyl-tRNA (Gln) amidotransferase subunit C [Parcubacteria group bacterium Gr01-1014_66]|nr:MAG: aspartyl-tRNA(Asn)/glutamyl-tRNA (Gln) amidotransferase subunit C [Parcubacteria group bacterium Gr01-1014_66]